MLWDLGNKKKAARAKPKLPIMVRKGEAQH